MKLTPNFYVFTLFFFAVGAFQNIEPKTPVHKCCPLNQIFDDKTVCTPSNITNDEYWKDYHVTVSMPTKYFIVGTDNETLHVLSGGILKLDSADEIEKFKKHSFCLDFSANGTKIGIIEFEPNKAEITLGIIYAFLQVLGIVCLVITGVIYLIVTPLRNYHGKSLACHTLFLALAMTINSFSVFHENEPVYKYLLRVANFSHLCSYFWLSIMWINIVCLSRHPIRVKMGTFEFCFSFLTVSAVSAMLIFFKTRNWLPSFDFFKNDKKDLLGCFIIIISVLLLINLIIYTYTFYKIQDNKNEDRINNGNTIEFHLDDQTAVQNNITSVSRHELLVKLHRCCLYLTLIASSCWFIDILVHCINSDAAKLDFPGACRGWLIFFVSVCVLEHKKVIVQHFRREQREVELQRYSNAQGFIPNVSKEQTDEPDDETNLVYPNLLKAA